MNLPTRIAVPRYQAGTKFKYVRNNTVNLDPTEFGSYCSRFILLKNILKIRTLTRTKFSIFAVVLYDNPTEIIFCCYSLNLLTYPGRIASY